MYIRTFTDASESYLVSAQVADMIAYVSHEFRSPLNVAIAGLEVMGKDVALLNLSPDFVETFNDVSSSAATAVDILDDLLHYENMDAGTFNVQLKQEPLSQAFGDNLNPLKTLAKSRFVQFEIENDVFSTSLPSTSCVSVGIRCIG